MDNQQPETWRQVEFVDANHPTDKATGQCPSCYSEGYEDAEKDFAAQAEAARKLLAALEAIRDRQCERCAKGLPILDGEHPCEETEPRNKRGEVIVCAGHFCDAEEAITQAIETARKAGVTPQQG